MLQVSQNTSLGREAWKALKMRGVAQLGSASALGAESRRFESCHPESWVAQR